MRPTATLAAPRWPSRPRTRPARWVAFLTLASIGLWAGFFGPIQCCWPSRPRRSTPTARSRSSRSSSASGAATSVICNPVFGAFSDRTTLRAGRRLPWVIAGAARRRAVAAAARRSRDNVVVMALGWCGVQASLNAMLAAVTATIPDQVPVGDRGKVGGILAIAQTVGVVGGTGIASATGSIAAGYLVTAAFLLVLTIPYCLDSRDIPLTAEERPAPFDWGAFLPVVLGLAARPPRLRVGLADPLPGQPRQRARPALPPLLHAGRHRLRQGRGGRPGADPDRDVRRRPDGDRGDVRHLERPHGASGRSS